MDHEATGEQLELAAVEPSGLDRLMAGDTPIAQAVAGHLAGCPGCRDELARLERTCGLVREVVRAMPPADLRGRTFAAVRSAGVQRGAGGVAPASAQTTTVTPRPASGARGRPSLGWFGAIAAAVVLSVVGTSMVVGWQMDRRLASQAAAITALERVTTATLEVTAEPDVRRVALAGADLSISGSVVFSPSTSELVVVATGLTPPPAGQEYRCWVERDGRRDRVGKMFFSDDLAYWIGPVGAVDGLLTGATFGVSLVDATGAALDGDPVLDGGLLESG